MAAQDNKTLKNDSTQKNHSINNFKNSSYKKDYKKSYKKGYKKDFHKSNGKGNYHKNSFHKNNKFSKSNKFSTHKRITKSDVAPLTKNTALIQFLNIKKENGQVIYNLSYPIMPKVYAYFVPLSSRKIAGIGSIIEINNAQGKNQVAVVVGEINVRGGLTKHTKLEGVTGKNLLNYFKKNYSVAKFYAKKADAQLKDILKTPVTEPSKSKEVKDKA